MERSAIRFSNAEFMGVAASRRDNPITCNDQHLACTMAYWSSALLGQRLSRISRRLPGGCDATSCRNYRVDGGIAIPRSGVGSVDVGPGACATARDLRSEQREPGDPNGGRARGGVRHRRCHPRIARRIAQRRCRYDQACLRQSSARRERGGGLRLGGKIGSAGRINKRWNSGGRKYQTTWNQWPLRHHAESRGHRDRVERSMLLGWCEKARGRVRPRAMRLYLPVAG